jgi:uncharacterized repeat protein (TIGR01451 family)
MTVTTRLEETWGVRVPVSFTVPSTAPVGASDVVTVVAVSHTDRSVTDSDSFTVVAAPIADLSVDVTDHPDPVLATERLTYTLTVTNSGPDTATGVVVTDTLPDGTTFLEALSTHGSCGRQDQTVTCSMDPISSGLRVSITVAVAPENAGIMENVVRVSGSERDPDPVNNIDRQMTIVDLADLSVNVIEMADQIVLGDLVTYTLTIANDGPANATGVVMTGTLSGDAVIESTDITLGACHTRSDVATCLVGDLNVGAVATATVVVKPTSVGTITTTASVAGNQPDFPSVDLASVLTVVLDPREEKTVYLPLIKRNFAP